MVYWQIKEFLLIYIIIVVNGSFRVQCEYAFKQTLKPNTPSMIQTIMQDMQEAFSSITNDTQLIRQMYGFEMANSDISTLLFKLPDSEENPETEVLVLMNRREFTKPVFPNLTKSYMTLRRLKVSKTLITENMDPNVRQLLKQEMLNLAQEYEKDAWSDMGLDGWKGDIADPKLPANEKYPQLLANDYPQLEITKDLNKGLVNEYFQDTNLIEKTDSVEAKEDINKNVFIARANDPFGYSTKWQMRNSSSQSKHKRDVLRLYSMIKCSTGCEPLVYKGYGCYCGFLGNGLPTDGIDRCCKQHDKCYEYSNCIPYLEYFVPYVWKCYHGKPLCAIDHGEWGGPHSCAARLCQCDLRLSRCLRKYACPGRRSVCRSSSTRRFQNILLAK